MRVALGRASSPGPVGLGRDRRPRREAAASIEGYLYAFFSEGQAMLSVSYRDAPEVPFVAELKRETDGQFAAMADSLLAGWRVRGTRRRLVRAALGHALNFETWRSLTRRA